MHGRIALALALVACTAPPPQPEFIESMPIAEPATAPSPPLTLDEPKPDERGQTPAVVSEPALEKSCDAGWQAFLADDPQAEELLLEGLEHSTTDRGRAACLYSLGRVFESKGQRPDAVVAYTKSLALRPDNAETQKRQHALTGTNDLAPAGDCPPKSRFADVESFCLALVAEDALADEFFERPVRDENQPFSCDVLTHRFSIDGIPRGELMIVGMPAPDGGPYGTIFLLLRRNGQLEPLGRVGTDIWRATSSGTIMIERARWQNDPVHLVVDLHWHYEYSGDETTPWQVDITDERYRMICADIDGRMRCSAPPEFASAGQAAAARFDPLPTGDALAAALSCPAM